MTKYRRSCPALLKNDLVGTLIIDGILTFPLNRIITIHARIFLNYRNLYRIIGKVNRVIACENDPQRIVNTCYDLMIQHLNFVPGKSRLRIVPTHLFSIYMIAVIIKRPHLQTYAAGICP